MKQDKSRFAERSPFLWLINAIPNLIPIQSHYNTVIIFASKEE